MTNPKRQPVPRVPPVKTSTRSTAHLAGEFPFTEVPKSGPVEKTPNEHTKEKITMANGATKLKNLIVDNKDVIRRKALVGVGAIIGLVVASAAMDRLNRPRVINNVIVVDGESDEITDPDSGPLEP
jgi:hypothetical protein